MRPGARAAAFAATAALLTSVGCGSTGNDDASAGRAYVEATETVERAQEAEEAAGDPHARELIARVRSECSGVLLGAPQRGGPLGREAFSAVEDARREGSADALAAFAKSASEMSFSDPELTAVVHRSARAARLLSETSAPDICADARSFVHARGASTPPGTARLLARERALESIELGGQRGLLEATIRRYSTRAQNARRAAHRRASEGRGEREYVSLAMQLLRVLGLPTH